MPADLRADIDRMIEGDRQLVAGAIDKAWARGYRSLRGLVDAARHYLEHKEDLFP